jgi:hypothetical protein
MRRCRRSASRGVCVRSPAITVEIIARNRQLSLHSYGFASEVQRCCFNGRRVLRRGSAVVSAARRRRRVWLAEGALRLTAPPAAAPMPSGVSLWLASAAPVPCPGAARLLAAKPAAVSGSVDGAAHNRSVEATSTGWPHMASCSFFALCGQPVAAPHLYVSPRRSKVGCLRNPSVSQCRRVGSALKARRPRDEIAGSAW